MNIYIKNTNGNCAAYQGVLVDVWHCDKDGNYLNTEELQCRLQITPTIIFFAEDRPQMQTDL
jgi:protocatechuate 3,4-dioxygenase beta subunit